MLKWTRIIIFVAIANPILYLISIGIGVGSLIDGNSPVDGVNYLTFLAPALLAAAAIQGMLDEVIFPTFQGFKWYKNFFAMNATPQTGRDIAVGVFFSALLRTTFTVLVYTIALYFFGALQSPKALLVVPASILAGAGFGALILALAARAKKDEFFYDDYWPIYYDAFIPILWNFLSSRTNAIFLAMDRLDFTALARHRFR